MMFASFNGVPAERGEFTAGRIYYARPAMDSGAAVSYDWIHILDDLGKPMYVRTGRGVSLSGACSAVALKRIVRGNDVVSAGYVVRVSGSDTPDTIVVDDLSRSVEKDWTGSFELLDPVIIIPGMYAGTIRAGRVYWRVIEKVYTHSTPEEIGMEVNLAGVIERVKGEDLVFPVSTNGDLLVSPRVVCVEAGGSDLKLGVEYELYTGFPESDEVDVWDNGYLVKVAGCRFEWIA